MTNRIVRSGVMAASMALAGWASTAVGQRGPVGPSATIRDGFEGPKVAWRQEQNDAPVKIFAHERTRRAAREGSQSEGFSFEAGIGGGLYYSYPMPKVPVMDDLKVGLYVRSNRAGVQIMARVVLPDDVDPDSRRPSFVLVAGSIYESVDRWQKLEIDDFLPAIEQQARVLRVSTRRKVSLQGAYLERLVVNVYGGEGESEVYLDDLTVGPVPPESAEEHARFLKGQANDRSTAAGPSGRVVADRSGPVPAPLESNRVGLNARIKLDRNRLTKDGFPFFPTAFRAPEADPRLIRKIACDALVIPRGADEAQARLARASGLFLVPELDGSAGSSRVSDPDRIASEAVAYPWKDDVLAWWIGSKLGKTPDLAARKAQLRSGRDASMTIHRARPGGSPFTIGSVVGMLPEYARVPENLDLIAIPAASWATTQDPYETYQYLEQRRLLTARSNADAPIWAEIDVTPPSIYRDSIWGTDRPPAWGLPRVQPEQVRLAAYEAIAAGARGLIFRADGDLSQGPGRMATIEVALLNEEIDLLEPILADPDKSTRMLDTYFPDPPPPPPISLFTLNTQGVGSRQPTPKEFGPNPTVKAAAISTKDRRGTLLMVADYDKYAQFQPGQMAINKLKLRVPAANDALAYLISPGGVRALDSVRTPGGHDITLDDFGVTAIVLMTTNADLKDQIERAINANRPKAVALAIEQAELQRAWVAEIDSLLQDIRHPQKDAADLLAKADELLKSAQSAMDREDYQVAWDEARRVARPLRLLMRYHFMAAYDAFVKALNDEDLPCGPVAFEGRDKPQPRIVAPIVAAPLASFNTLPQAWTWVGWARDGRLGRNAVASGHFNEYKVGDSLREMAADGWSEESYRTDELESFVSFVKGGPDNAKNREDGGSNLVLQSLPRKGYTIDGLPPFVDHPTVAVRSPSIPVRAQEVYRISVMAKLPAMTAPGAGGLIVRDSIGGERLQYRSAQAIASDWHEIVFYRRVPADGKLSVTLGLAGYGWCAFDDLKIEPIVEQLDPDRPKVAVRPRRAPSPATTTPAANAPTSPARTAVRPRPMPFRQ